MGFISENAIDQALLAPFLGVEDRAGRRCVGDRHQSPKHSCAEYLARRRHTIQREQVFVKGAGVSK